MRILRFVGWGTATNDPSIIAFTREVDEEGRGGWRIGTGIIVAPFEGREVPEDREQALYEIELYYNRVHQEATGQPLVPDLELLSRVAELAED